MTSPQPRVLHVISHFALGGAERVALTIIKSLESEFSFSIHAVRGRRDDGVGKALEQEVQAEGIPYHTGSSIPMRYGGMLTGAYGLARSIRRFDPDIVHLHSEIPESSYALLAALRWNARSRKAVRTIHNSTIWSFYPALGRWCDRRLQQAKCVAVSQGAADEMIRLRGESGASQFSEPLPIITNGVSPASVRKSRWQVGPRYEIVFGGRFEPEKGIDLIPKILPLVQVPDDREARLTLFGTGSVSPMLEELRRNPPSGWTIEISPPVAHFRDRLPDYDLLIMPSRFEGLPLVGIESALAGLPIVAARAPGLTEVLPSDHPWWAKAGDASDFALVLSQAMFATAQWESVAGNSQKFAESNFSDDHMARGYREFYRDMLKSH